MKRNKKNREINGIARKACVNKGTIIKRYKNKNNLIEKVAVRSLPVKEITIPNKRDHNSAKELLIDFGMSFF
jgi:AcrR family transcriptional regulator